MRKNTLIFLADLVSFWLALVLLVLWRFPLESFWETIKLHAWPFSLLYTSWVLVFYTFELYNIFRIKPTIPHLRRFGLAILTSLAVGVIVFYFVPFFGITPKTNLLIELGLFTILSFVGRRIIYKLFATQSIQPVILIGATPYLDELRLAIESNPQTGLKIAGQTAALETALQQFRHLSRPLFIFESFTKEIPTSDIIAIFKKQIEIIDIAEAYERHFAKIPINYINADWIIANINNRPRILYNIILRIRDIALAIFLIIITLPVTIPASLTIYLYDKKNIFYVSRRAGINGKSFNYYKLRSMYATLDKNPDATGSRAMWYQTNDSRVTPIGKIIRKLHIDEIPQMWNIIRGEMSLVGPRPERFEFIGELEKRIPNYGLRHIVRPGFTGWAQIKYRYAHNTDDTREKFEYDLYYIKNKNFFLDLGIILRTIQIIFTH